MYGEWDIDFPGGDVYNQNGSVGPQREARIREKTMPLSSEGKRACPCRLMVGSEDAVRRVPQRPETARCLPERNGAKNPTRTALWAQGCTEAAWPPGRKSAIGRKGLLRRQDADVERKLRGARQETCTAEDTSAAGVFFVVRRQRACAAGLSPRGRDRRYFCGRSASVLRRPAIGARFVDLPETAGHTYFIGGECT